MSEAVSLAPYFDRLAVRPAWRWHGRVVEANGQTIESEGPRCSVGECCEIVDADGGRHEAEVIGFRGAHVLAMPLDATQGIRYGDALAALGAAPQMALSEQMTGRVLDALGRPLDGMAPLRIGGSWPLDGNVPNAMEREPIKAALDGGAGAGWDADGGARAAGGDLWRIGRGQEHADRDDDAEYGGGPDGGGAGGRARARGARVSGGLARRGGKEALGGAGVDVG
jgi:hypothetical protein